MVPTRKTGRPGEGQQAAGTVVGSDQAASTVLGKNPNSPHWAGIPASLPFHEPLPTFLKKPSLLPIRQGVGSSRWPVADGSIVAIAQYVSVAGS